MALGVPGEDKSQGMWGFVGVQDHDQHPIFSSEQTNHSFQLLVMLDLCHSVGAGGGTWGLC